MKGCASMEEANLDFACEERIVHKDLTERIQRCMPSEDTLYELADLFRVFGDSTRVKILFVLLESEMCVCDIAEVLGMTQSAISHQLRVLKQSKLVSSRREGKSMVCFLTDDHVRSILAQGMSHVTE